MSPEILVPTKKSGKPLRVKLPYRPGNRDLLKNGKGRARVVHEGRGIWQVAAGRRVEILHILALEFGEVHVHRWHPEAPAGSKVCCLECIRAEHTTPQECTCPCQGAHHSAEWVDGVPIPEGILVGTDIVTGQSVPGRWVRSTYTADDVRRAQDVIQKLKPGGIVNDQYIHQSITDSTERAS